MIRRPMRETFTASFVPLVLGDRGGVPDFVRLGAWAACDARGRVVSQAGDPSLVAFLRSSAKPFQAIAFLRRGLDRELGLDEADVACACASHEGEDCHVRSARRILASAGLDESELLCGTHPPPSRELQQRIARGETELASIHNNCSGKHSAMLATCAAEGWDRATYTQPSHPLQRENLATLAAFAGVEPAAIAVAVDNCTVPTFALPLRATARAFARLMDPEGLPDELAGAGSRAVAAMTARPEMVGGSGRFDTALMRLTAGRVVAKTGANGFYAAAGRRPDGGVVGIAIKLAGAEGESQKAPSCIHAMLAAGLLRETEAAELLSTFDVPLLDCRGGRVGATRWLAP